MNNVAPTPRAPAFSGPGDSEQGNVGFVGSGTSSSSSSSASGH